MTDGLTLEGIEEALAALSPAERAEVARAVEHLQRRMVEAPLSMACLWTHGGAEWDQRRAAILALEGPLAVGIGGNRSGKTEGIGQGGVAMALGRSHPHVQAWCRNNRIPPELIPEGPGEVVVLSQTASASAAYTRELYDRYLPAGATWYARRALGPAHVRIPVPGYRREAIIRFGSVDQGPRGIKGSAARMYHVDEEPEGEDGRLVLQECLRGASALGGVVVITATPQAGLTWMVEKLVLAGKYGARVSRLNSLHNRFAPNYAALVRYLERLDPQERRLRQEGVWYDREGLIYPGWSRGLHYVPSIEHSGQTYTAGTLPASWRRYRGIDAGQTSPAAVVWVAVVPDGRLVVYRCAKQAGVPYPEWADRIHAAEGAVRRDDGRWVEHVEHASGTWMDPSAPDAADQLRRCGVQVRAGTRKPEDGISLVADALRCDARGRPGLVVLEGEGTADLVREVEDYRRDPRSKVGAIRKVRDHLCDALRYCIHGLYRVEGLHGVRPAAPTEPPAD